MQQRLERVDKSQIKIGRWVLASTVLASAMDFASQSAVNVALPAIQTSLQATGVQLLWIINGYALLLAALLLIGGSLGDKLGRKRIFMSGIGLYAVASLAASLAPSAQFLVVARALQGVGGALMIPGSLALIAAYFPPESRGAAYGTWAAVTTIAMVAGPLIGGFLAQAGLWRMVFFMNVPIAAAALTAVGLNVPETRDEEKTAGIDWIGAALGSLGLTGLVYALISAPELGFAHPRIYGSIIIGFFGLVGFVLVERFIPRPMLPLGFFRSRTFSGANLLTFFLYAGLYGYIVFFTLNLIQGQGYRESLAGFAILPFILLLAAISRWSGKLSDKWGPRWFLILGPLLVAVSFLLHSFIGQTSGPRDYWLTFFPAVSLLGVGMGLTVAPLTTTVMSSVPAKHAGTASGINNAVSRIAAVLAVAVLGSIALFHFSTEIRVQAEPLGLPSSVMTELQGEAARLGEASVPSSVPTTARQEVEMVLRTAFVDTYKLMMLMCMALAMVSALLAAILIGRQPAKEAGVRRLFSGDRGPIRPVSQGVRK
jgi:EmrB/QacA subfamily drug resistance transporter